MSCAFIYAVWKLKVTWNLLVVSFRRAALPESHEAGHLGCKINGRLGAPASVPNMLFLICLCESERRQGAPSVRRTQLRRYRWNDERASVGRHSTRPACRCEISISFIVSRYRSATLLISPATFIIIIERCNGRTTEHEISLGSESRVTVRICRILAYPRPS